MRAVEHKRKRPVRGAWCRMGSASDDVFAFAALGHSPHSEACSEAPQPHHIVRISRLPRTHSLGVMPCAR